ncbi:Tetratricopeptide-like helical domain superfamily [Arabidopsis suecica]|uniref:Tetratricopeptide-like helical domain superfamily n=1 Tax=Arabidopsis suecica TaxID=45249 RepID=A0A8T2DXV7_ARASU|nr:Tetratricopeptide-like helical domain superfamily [Arabidopsis suecica]
MTIRSKSKGCLQEIKSTCADSNILFSKAASSLLEKPVENIVRISNQVFTLFRGARYWRYRRSFKEHGKTKEAIDLFEKSLKVGLKPDSVTFISVLTACTHSGHLDLGFHYFNLMKEKYNIRPAKEHYGCMVDLLCRAGRLSDAEQMINEMPWKKDDVVWTTLLNACKAKGDTEHGRRAAETIQELDPTSETAFVTLANIYSSTGKLEEAAHVRKVMKSNGVIKVPGWSSIKIMDRDSTFVSSSRSHSQSEDIYSTLELVVSGAEAHIDLIVE